MKNVVLSLVVGVLFGLSLPQVAMALTPQELVEQQHRIDEAHTQADQEAFKQRQNNPAPSACQVAWNSSSAAATCRLIGNAIQQQSDGSCQLQVSCSQAGTRPVEVWANNAAEHARRRSQAPTIKLGNSTKFPAWLTAMVNWPPVAEEKN